MRRERRGDRRAAAWPPAGERGGSPLGDLVLARGGGEAQRRLAGRAGSAHRVHGRRLPPSRGLARARPGRGPQALRSGDPGKHPAGPGGVAGMGLVAVGHEPDDRAAAPVGPDLQHALPARAARARGRFRRGGPDGRSGRTPTCSSGCAGRAPTYVGAPEVLTYHAVEDRTLLDRLRWILRWQELPELFGRHPAPQALRAARSLLEVDPSDAPVGRRRDRAGRARGATRAGRSSCCHGQRPPGPFTADMAAESLARWSSCRGVRRSMRRRSPSWHGAASDTGPCSCEDRAARAGRLAGGPRRKRALPA